MPHRNLKATAFPYQVTDPQLGKSNFQYYAPESGECDHPNGVKVLEVIYFSKEAKSSYTIAKLAYKGSECLGIRWNIASTQYNDKDCYTGKHPCLGFPYSVGYPTWFILPDNLNIYEDKIIISKMRK